jgi:hypothetical protein
VSSIADIIGPAEPARIVTLPESNYRPLPRMNPSTLVAGLRGDDYDPFAVKHAWETPSTRRTNQDTLDRGTLGHLFMLEPNRVKDAVALWPSSKRRAGGDWDTFQEANEHKLIIREDDFAEIMFGCAQARATDAVARLLDGVAIEQSVLWSEYDIRCKGRFDAGKPIDRHGIVNIVDLKTTENGIDNRSTDNTTRSLRYREKMAFYRRGVSKALGVDKYDVRCTLIFVQLSPPYGVNVKPISSDALDLCEEKMMTLLGRVRECIRRGQALGCVANGFPIMSVESAIGLSPWEQADQAHEMEVVR